MLDPGTPLGEIGEKALVRHLKSRIPQGPGVRLGVGDDAAAVETGALTLVTTDALVEGIHFRREWTPPRLLGRKALTVNLSDIAAMGGAPRYATISLLLPRDLPLGFLDGLYDGLLERCAETGVSLVGGNVAAAPGPSISMELTVLGSGDRLLTRSGARPGDLVVVTGAIGASAAGLKLLSQGARLGEEGQLLSTGLWTESSASAVVHCLRAHLDPFAPLAFARLLVDEDNIVHAAMDLSDGLSSDLLEICEQSEVCATLDADTIPIDRTAWALERAQGGDALSLALHGGEDYQMLLAVPPGSLDLLRDRAVIFDLPWSVVGVFHEGEPAVTLRRGTKETALPPAGFDHLRNSAPTPPPPPSPALEATLPPGHARL